MHEFLSFNGEILRASEVNLPAVSPAAFYGRGVFTTVAVYDSKPFQWAKHWQRLNENAKTVGVDLTEFTETAIENSILEIVSRNDFRNGRARLTFFDESPNDIWRFETKRKTSFLIASARFRPVSNKLRLTVSPVRVNSTSPLAGVKSCNYLENLLVLEQAKSGGYDEAIRLNEKNEIVSATTANVFWTKNGEIFTPALETGALDGTTRDFITKNFPVCETKAVADKLIDTDEIFLTSAGIGVVFAESVENRKYQSSNMFVKIRKFFDEAVHNYR